MTIYADSFLFFTGGINRLSDVGDTISISRNLTIASPSTFSVGVNIVFASGLSSPSINQAATSSGSGTSLTIQAQGATGATHNGGNLILTSGTSGSATVGNLLLQTGGSTAVTVTPTGVTFSLPLTLQSNISVNTFTVTTATYTVDSGSTADYQIFCNRSGTIAITLPTPTNGRVLIIKDISGAAATNNITISQHASEKIDGANTYVLNFNYESITLTSDGTNWFAV